ncbi:MAG: hypothetical protein N4A45_04060 [Flavobacteriales bacterium]|jgi:hemerythrin superfamily protein|nr:hypothetical protein [Flavobacteriales bacterium]
MKTLNTVSMYALDIDKNDFFERLSSLSQESQRIIFNKISELREEEEKEEKLLLEAIKEGEESGISEITDIKGFINNMYQEAKNNEQNA